MSRQIEIEIAPVVNPLMRAISECARINKQTITNNSFAGPYSARCDIFAFTRIEAQGIKYSGIVRHLGAPKVLK